MWSLSEPIRSVIVLAGVIGALVAIFSLFGMPR